MEYKQQTADKIFDAAKKVFVEKGFDGARTQRIADEGGVNKALLHYYFKTKERLFELTYKDSIDKLFDTIELLLANELPIETKIDGFVDGLSDFCIQNPLIPTFIFGELFGSQKSSLYDIVKEKKCPNEFEGKESIYYAMLSMTLFPFIAMPFMRCNCDFESYLEENKTITKKMLKIHIGLVNLVDQEEIDRVKEAQRAAKAAIKAAKEAEKAAKEIEKEAERLAKEAEKEAEKRKKLQEYNLFDDPAQYKLF